MSIMGLNCFLGFFICDFAEKSFYVFALSDWRVIASGVFISTLSSKVEFLVIQRRKKLEEYHKTVTRCLGKILGVAFCNDLLLCSILPNLFYDEFIKRFFKKGRKA